MKLDVGCRIYMEVFMVIPNSCIVFRIASAGISFEKSKEPVIKICHHGNLISVMKNGLLGPYAA
jgi:hypothetical protein